MPRFDANGNWYGWDAPESELTRAKARCTAFVVANLILSVLCGVCPTAVTRDDWVCFAATAALVALMVELIGVVRFRHAKAYLSRQEFGGIHRMMTWAPVYHILLTAVAWIAAVMSCVRAFSGPLDVLVSVGFLLMGLCSIGMYRAYKGIRTFEMKEVE